MSGKCGGLLAWGVLVALLSTGCASGPSPEEQLVEKDQQIAMMQGQLDRSKQSIIRAEEEGESLHTQLQAEQEQKELLTRHVETVSALVDEKEQKAQAMQDLVQSERKRADLAVQQALTARESSASRGTGTEEGGSTGAVAGRPGAGGPGKYHLRIISLPKNESNERAIREISTFLESQSVSDVVPRTSGQFWVVDIGYFASVRSQEAQSLRDKIQGLKFQGVKQFQSAYFVTY